MKVLPTREGTKGFGLGDIQNVLWTLYAMAMELPDARAQPYEGAFAVRAVGGREDLIRGCVKGGLEGCEVRV